MKKIITFFLVCVLLTTVVQANIVVSVTQIDDPGYSVPSLEYGHWIELPTQSSTSWIVQTDENIFDLLFGTWDDDDYLTPGNKPFTSYTSTWWKGGGPLGDPYQSNWRTLRMWDGTMPYCTYWEISIDHKAALWGSQQNLWVSPEPATIALLGLGGLALLRRKRSN